MKKQNNIFKKTVFLSSLLISVQSYAVGTIDSTNVGQSISAYDSMMGNCQSQTVNWLSSDGKQTCSATTNQMQNGDMSSVSSTSPTGKADIGCDKGNIIVSTLATCGVSDCQSTCMVWWGPGGASVCDVQAPDMKEGEEHFYYSTGEYNGYAVIQCTNGKEQIAYRNPAQSYQTKYGNSVNYSQPNCHRTGTNSNVKYDSCYQGGVGG